MGPQCNVRELADTEGHQQLARGTEQSEAAVVRVCDDELVNDRARQFAAGRDAWRCDDVADNASQSSAR
jgi:hypothetical protein